MRPALRPRLRRASAPRRSASSPPVTSRRPSPRAGARDPASARPRDPARRRRRRPSRSVWWRAAPGARGTVRGDGVHAARTGPVPGRGVVHVPVQARLGEERQLVRRAPEIQERERDGETRAPLDARAPRAPLSGPRLSRPASRGARPTSRRVAGVSVVRREPRPRGGPRAGGPALGEPVRPARPADRRRDLERGYRRTSPLGQAVLRLAAAAHAGRPPVRPGEIQRGHELPGGLAIQAPLGGPRAVHAARRGWNPSSRACPVKHNLQIWTLASASTSRGAAPSRARARR